MIPSYFFDSLRPSKRPFQTTPLAARPIAPAAAVCGGAGGRCSGSTAGWIDQCALGVRARAHAPAGPAGAAAIQPPVRAVAGAGALSGTAAGRGCQGAGAGRCCQGAADATAIAAVTTDAATAADAATADAATADNAARAKAARRPDPGAAATASAAAAQGEGASSTDARSTRGGSTTEKQRRDTETQESPCHSHRRRMAGRERLAE